MDKDALKTFKKTDLVEIFVVWINHFTARINISTFTEFKTLIKMIGQLMKLCTIGWNR